MTPKTLLLLGSIGAGVLLGAGCAAPSAECDACDAAATKTVTLSKAPCMDVLGKFTASDVPALGPAETEVPARHVGARTRCPRPPVCPAKAWPSTRCSTSARATIKCSSSMTAKSSGLIPLAAASNTTMPGCSPTATSCSAACNISPRSRRRKKSSGVMIAPRTPKCIAASRSARTRCCSSATACRRS